VNEGFRVAYDETLGSLGTSGSATYVRELGSTLRQRLDGRLLGLCCPGARARGGSSRLQARTHTLLRDLWWYSGGFAQEAARRGATLVHATFPSRRGRTPLVLTLFDVAVLRHPERFRRWFRFYARRTFGPRVRAADAVVTLSEAARSEICAVLGADPSRVFVVPCGVRQDLGTAVAPAVRQQVLERYRIDRPFLLTVGAAEPRKNLPRLLEAIAQLRASPETRDILLVHAGPPGWLLGDLAALGARYGLGAHFRAVGEIPQEDLVALYQSAHAVAYPSLYEGFGLPVLEAMAAGTPVVTSNCSSMPEIAGDAAVLVDPQSVSSIADGIHQVWFDETLRRELIDRGQRRARRYTWEAAADATITIYERVLGS
jgi:glycosyltransferase involved in cell wall biosynthesis